MYNETLALEINKRHEANLMRELAPLLGYMNDKDLTDIFVYGRGNVKLMHFYKGTLDTGIVLPVEQRRRIIHYLASMAGLPINAWKRPTLEGIVPGYNARMTAVIEPWVKAPELTIRHPPDRIFTLEQYRDSGRLKPEWYDFLIERITLKDNILVGGATGSGKTTFLNACIQKVVELFPDDRILIIEDILELQCASENMTSLYIRKDQAQEALEFALRWTPKRLIFGELRSGLITKVLLEAWNSGHPGNFTTVHADSAQSMLRRIRGLLSQEIIGTLPDVADYIHLCVHLSYKPGFGPYVDEILPTRTIDSLSQTIEQLYTVSSEHGITGGCHASSECLTNQ